MPELPEAETIARGLHAAIAGSRVERVRVHRAEVVEPMSPAAFRRALTDRRIKSVGRRAKWIVASLDDGNRWVTQLRMTGRFDWSTASSLRARPHLSVSVLVRKTDIGGVLRFYDVRRFARMWVLNPAEWSELDERLGIEPLSDEFTTGSLASVLAPSKAPIRNVLLDQRRVAGIGNIYASEACYMARVDPRRPATSLEMSEVRKLHRAIRKILGEAVDRRGTSFSDYRDLLGDEGTFQNELDVYDREDEICRRCRAKIIRVVLAGRSAYLCPGCQK
jgi:formamidopyrimidine-DNA glycosylase